MLKSSSHSSQQCRGRKLFCRWFRDGLFLSSWPAVPFSLPVLAKKKKHQKPREHIALLHWLFSGPLQLSFCVWLIGTGLCVHECCVLVSHKTALRCAAQPSQAQRQYSRWKKWCSPRGRTTLLDFPFPAAGSRSRDRMVASTWDLQLIAADFKIVRPLTGELAWVQLNACTCIIGDRDFVLSILDFLEKMISSWSLSDYAIWKLCFLGWCNANMIVSNMPWIGPRNLGWATLYGADINYGCCL